MAHSLSEYDGHELAGVEVLADVVPFQSVHFQSNADLSGGEYKVCIPVSAPPASAPEKPPNNAIGEFFVPMTMNIPEEHCLLPGSITPDMKVPSDCQYELRGFTEPEVVGCDPRMNDSADEITRFFLTHLKKPRVFVKVEGWHTVTKRKRVNGHTSTTQHRVTDFE